MGIYARHNDEWYRVDECDADANGGGAPGAAVVDGTEGPVSTYSIEQDGQAYDIYEFTGSGKLILTSPGLCQLLLLAGGGGAAGGRGGGGGAGGLLQVSQGFLTNDEGEDFCTVAVGAGGSPNVQGNDTFVTFFRALGGGRSSAGGGSGGGGQTNSGGGSGAGDQGKNGGGGNAAGCGGGGGFSGNGAGASGGDPNWIGGNGGPGTDVSSFINADNEMWVAGGGGGGAAYYRGGTGGKGGGGNGSASADNATAGAQYTGGGGGGGGLRSGNMGSSGKGGGSGLAFVKVPVSSPSFGPKVRAVTPKTAYAARIEDGVVRQVITIPHLDDDDNKITEYCNKIGLPGTWVDTSYTGARRGKYAGVGDLFDPRLRNAEFVSPEVEVEE